jgi:hypothetical protein
VKRFVIHPYLFYNIAAVQKQLMGIASLVKEIRRKSLSVIDSTFCINNAILCSGTNDVGHISEGVLNSPDGNILLNWPIGHFLCACFKKERNLQ